MQLQYDLGDPRRPRGHAFIYYRASGDPGHLLASYLVVPPIVLDLAKYIPPMFAGTLPGLDMSQLNRAVPLPPIPEAVESYDYLRRLAESRSDDLIVGGDVNPNAPDQLMFAVAQAADAYSQAYQEWASQMPADERPALELNVDEVLYELMTETERLQELVKLVGKVRYGIEVNDRQTVAEAARQAEVLGRYFPDSYRVTALLTAAQRPTPAAARLSDLYVQRIYKLHQQNYSDLIELESQIHALEGQSAHE